MRKKLNKVIILIPCILLSACSCKMPKEVYLPVTSNHTSVKIPPKPPLPIEKLTDKSKPNDVVKAYAASVNILIGYNNQLISLLKVYE